MKRAYIKCRWKVGVRPRNIIRRSKDFAGIKRKLHKNLAAKANFRGINQEVFIPYLCTSSYLLFKHSKNQRVNLNNAGI